MATAYLVLFINKADESLSADIFGTGAGSLTLAHHLRAALDVVSCSVATGADTDFRDAILTLVDLVRTNPHYDWVRGMLEAAIERDHHLHHIVSKHRTATPDVPHAGGEGC